MNINLSLICQTCGERTNCRVGLSNRSHQPLRFRCKDCGAPIDITLDLDFKNGGVSTTIVGARDDSCPEHFPFSKEVNFVDLHLDFPVTFDHYVMGLTPFMAAMGRISFESYHEFKFRIDSANQLYEDREKVRAIFTLYARDKNSLFKEKVLRYLDAKMPCDSALDRNRALYFAIEHAYAPFSEYQKNVDFVKGLTDKILQLNDKDTKATERFIREIVDTKFLKNFQVDCLQIYPRILDLELLLRPAIFLDYDRGYDGCIVPYRVSTHEFDEVKDIYKDIVEVLNRGLILLAGLNNLEKRRDHHRFAEKHTKKGIETVRDLNEFADKPLGLKLDWIDESWYIMERSILDNQLRNSVAHFKAEYDEVSQVITYYPKKEGINQDAKEDIFFLDFSRRILQSFRELHRFNHLAKCLFVHYYLDILKVPATPVLQK
ncbi:hypothetical protein [Herbaspirillum sp.]|uniref:hypothetical protein n=1 Tax=Herbaspirillum TaxID=963 RepID=UPI00258ACB31|nr:hypothetical protein [Herbaspirillum sp.]MCP3655819.1 hypothetical protein [Herbaspirillum sp.]MCP3948006.1 hypothetical protein [Herbaspirillum sp.]MCP4030647.1 hypothetical protein [Herbaspirillum sp.]MCP4557484.1 hypothetical protein [Herbaspirillum sp.]